MERGREILRQVREWITPYWEELQGAPQLLWKWTEGRTAFRVAAVGLAVALALAVLWLIIGFFRSGWKGKIRTVFVAAVGFLAVSALLLAAKREVAGFLQPETESLLLGGREVRLYPQYSLARGRDEANMRWTLTDAVVTLPVDEDLVVQLSDLDGLCAEGGYRVEQIQRTKDGLGLQLWRQFESWRGDNVQGLSLMTLELWVLPNRELRQTQWYLDAGQTGQGSRLGKEQLPTSFTVLSNTGDELLMILQTDGFPDSKSLAVARQLGPDVVLGISCGNCSEFDRKTMYSPDVASNRFFFYDPEKDEDRAVLAEPFQALFSGGIRCLRGLTAEERERVLPDRIVDYPVENTEQKNGGFAIPCAYLEEMMTLSLDAERFVLRFAGEGPAGEQVLYTLYSGAVYADFLSDIDQDSGWFTDWEKAFEAGCASPDETMSAFLGAPAVPYEEGWLLNPGSYVQYGSGSPITCQEYYLLTMEPLP